MSPAEVALIETVRVRDGEAPLWPWHVARLARGCRTLGIPMPALAAPRGDDRVVRFEVGPGGVAVSERPVGPTAPLRLVTARAPHPGYPHKTTARAPFDAARAEAASLGADDALLLVGGAVGEATIWTLLWWDAHGLLAPDPTLGVLPAVSRARLRLIAGPVRPARADPGEVAARGLFAANAARGIVPVGALDGVPVRTDARTMALADRFWP